MGQVIQLSTKQNVDQELVEFFEEALASARRGQARGFIGVLDQANGKQRVVSRGTFACDEERAIRIASLALDSFCTQAGVAHPKVNAACALPPRLRRTS